MPTNWWSTIGGGSVDYNIPATAMANVVKIGSTITAYEADGTVISTGTDAATVINATLAFLPLENWSLNIMPGVYTITANLDFTNKKMGHCHWGGVTFIANIANASTYVITLGQGTARNAFTGVMWIDLGTNDKKFGMQLMEDMGSNYFEQLRIVGHGTNKATIGLKLGGTGVGLANDDNMFKKLHISHCNIGIQIGETVPAGGTNVYHNSFQHVIGYGTTTMVSTGRTALQNWVMNIGFETGTQVLHCAGNNNTFEIMYLSGGSPILGDFYDNADLNTVYVHQYASHLPLTDTSTTKTTSLIFMGKNTIAVSAITPGASSYTYTNADLYEEDVIVSGGTVTLIRFIRGGVLTELTGITSGIFRLGPQDGLRVTYSSVPTMIKIPR